MNINPIDEAFGLYQISKGISQHELEWLARIPSVKTIQLVSPLENKEIKLLESIVFSKRPDILLRIYGHYGLTCDLTSYLENIPSVRNLAVDSLQNAIGIEYIAKLKNIEELSIGIYHLDNFDFLNEINPSIKKLSLTRTKAKTPRIEALERLKDLEYLYLEGQERGIEAVNQLKNLKQVVLRSISTSNLDYLQGLENLWSVNIKLGGIKNFEALKTLPNLKYLELWQVRGLSDLSFISELISLQNLFIQSLKQFRVFPSLAKSSALRRIHLENLKGLADFTGVTAAPALEDFIYVQAANQKPENLIPVLENTNLKYISCGLGKVKNDAFKELVVKYGKKEYKPRPFEYK